jgi:Heparan-alpha-glucosaminide N-acetyltransferase, catalytic
MTKITKTNKKDNSKIRLYSLDILRGISMFLMLLAHAMTYWPDENSFWVMPIYFIILNISGTSQFTYVAGLGLSFSWLQYRAKGMSEKEIYQKSMSRTYVMIIVSIGYNFVATIVRGTGLAGLWCWNILQCIAFCRLIGTFLMALQRKMRFFIAIALVFLTGIITWWMVPLYATNIPAKLVFYLFYNPMHGDGFLVFFPFFLMGTVLGEIVFEIVRITRNASNPIPKATQKVNPEITSNSTSEIPSNADIEIISLLKYWLKIGIVIFLTGILIGLTPTGPKYDYYELIFWINTHPNIMISTLPLFLMPNSFAWALYCSGWHIILTVLFVYYIDVLKKSHKPWTIFVYFGKYSLTIYFFHYLFLMMPYAIYPNFALNHIWVQIAFVLFELLNWWFAYIIDKKWNMKVSFEYLILLGSNLIYNKMIESNKGEKT